MLKVGIIAEYNPFHNGHLYHLKETKKMYPNSHLILILIGNFTQRGDASIINKWDKTKIALEYGFDLVIELPFNIATSSADIYAYGAVKILDELKCDYLVFGSETNDINTFKKVVNDTKNNNLYQAKIKTYLDLGYNYPKACSCALNDLNNITINKPNDVLAIEYVRSIDNLNSKIIPISIKRTNNYDDLNIKSNITSASAIRSNLSNKTLIKKTMPKLSYDNLKSISYDTFFNILKHEIIINDNLSKILDVTEGIENKLKKEIMNTANINDLILKVKSKRYSYNRLKRMMLHIVTNTKKDYDININYIRVLGMSNNGIKILNEAKKNVSIPIITKFKKEYEALFFDDIKAAKVYSLMTNYNYKDEFKTSIKKNN